MISQLIVGNGLFIDVTYPYNAVKCNIFLFIAGIGIGGLFVPPLIALQAAMPTRDRAVAMGSLVLFRLLGSAVGMAVGGTILNNQLATRLASEPQYILNNLTIPFQALQYITPTALKDFVLNAYALYLLWLFEQANKLGVSGISGLRIYRCVLWDCVRAC